MKIEELLKSEEINFDGIDLSYFLIGLLSAFNNRFQAFADKFLGELSWKQFFAIICINLCNGKPTINELAEILGSSHQNVKQILLKLEKKNFINIVIDAADKRKQRIELTDYCRDYCNRNDSSSNKIMSLMFEGISKDELQMTIQTIMKIEGNINNIGGNYE